MATRPISTGELFQSGRLAVTGASFLRYAETVNTDTLQFVFPTATSGPNTFGIPASVSIDNSLNDYQLRVVVEGTRQTFPIPANSTGTYNVDAQQGSNILITSDGPSSGPVTFVFYNVVLPPVVWYKFGAVNTDDPFRVQGTMAEGSDVTVDPTINKPVMVAGVDPTGSILRNIQVDNQGRLVVVGGGGGPVTVANGADVAQGNTTDPAIVNPATNGTLIGFTRGILTGINSIFSALSAFSFNNITTDTTTVVKNSPGTLGKVTVNTAGGAGTIIIYNNTSATGSIIATLDSTVVGSFDYNINASVGITVVTTGAPNITVSYK